MFLTTDRLDFDREGRLWPHRERSKFVTANGGRWHVQTFGPENADRSIVLLHGTGASTHSWRALVSKLPDDVQVISLDLPGQGFSDPLKDRDPTLPNMGRAVASLLDALNIKHPLLIGHSAGAAIALQLALDRPELAERVISINGALYPFPGAASSIFPILAKMLFLNPFVPHIFAAGAQGRHRVERLLQGTGSKLDDEGLALYQTLFSNPSHVRSTLSWMANWNLEPLVERMGDVKQPFLQIIGSEDETIPPGNAFETETRIRHAETIKLRGYGHLVHEEEPGLVAHQVLSFSEKTFEPV
ncbi:MAG: alpha/beta fold hydrolase BchO [Pseudomonadota bacterium]